MIAKIVPIALASFELELIERNLQNMQTTLASDSLFVTIRHSTVITLLATLEYNSMTRWSDVNEVSGT